MRKRILLIALAITLGGLLLFSIVASEVSYNRSVQMSLEHMRLHMRRFDEDITIDKAGARTLSDALGMRVTFMKLDGEVIADSAVDALDSHAERKEVLSAIEDGEGYSDRKSSTVGKNMLYYCKKFPDEAVLVRLAYDIDSQGKVFLNYLPTLLPFLLLNIVFCLLFTWLSTSYILEPVEKLAKEAGRRKTIRTSYSELQPLAEIMNQMNEEIDLKISHLNEEKQLVALILDNMEEGIVIYRSVGDILLINKKAAELLDYADDDIFLRFLIKDKELKEASDAKQHSVHYRTLQGRDYAFRFAPQEENTVLLLTDVTELKQASRSKDEFIANVTHEMFTPLTSIRGFAELIGGGRMEKAKIMESAGIIARQSDRLKQLINSILKYSEIGAEQGAQGEIHLAALIENILHALEPMIREKDITVTTALDRALSVVSAPETMEEIAMNLLSNAVRYNRQGGSIHVEIVKKKNRPALIVSDTGIGIAEKDIPRIFDRFFTVDSAHNGSGGGFGLGLAIVKKLALKAGYKISVDSKEQEGTVFQVLF